MPCIIPTQAKNYFARRTIEGKRRGSGEVQEGVLLKLPQACIIWFSLAPLALHLHFIGRQNKRWNWNPP
jgi:hypothetical protein